MLFVNFDSKAGEASEMHTLRSLHMAFQSGLMFPEGVPFFSVFSLLLCLCLTLWSLIICYLDVVGLSLFQ